MKRLVLITLCAVILPASLTRSEQRTITVTGFAIHEYTVDWVHFSLTARLEGGPGKRLGAAINAKADSIKAWLGSLGPNACSLGVFRIEEWRDRSYDESHNRGQSHRGLSFQLDAWLRGPGLYDKVIQKYGSAKGCFLRVMGRGLTDDSVAVREVSDLALADAHAQALATAEGLGMVLGDPVSVQLNPIAEIQELNGYGLLSSRGGQDGFYSRGQIPAASGWGDTPHVVRRAVAVVTYAVR